MKKWKKIALTILLVLLIAFFLGPKEPAPALDLPSDFQFDSPAEASEYVTIKSTSRSDIKPNNQSRIVWANENHGRTDVCFVYLHGFSASGGEGAPTHEMIAKRFGANLYIPRLFGHGVDVDEPLLDFDGGRYLQSAREAIEVGKALGEKVIVIGTSTGGTAAIYLAAEMPSIAGLVLYAPNVDLFDPTSELITLPWGQNLMDIVKGGRYHSWDISDRARPYWYGRYRTEGILALKALVEATMTAETFERIEQPIFVTYYYKDEENKDEVISIDAIDEMLEAVATPVDRIRNVPNSEGDGHVLISDIVSDNLEQVQKDTFSFLEEVMQLEPKK